MKLRPWLLACAFAFGMGRAAADPNPSAIPSAAGVPAAKAEPVLGLDEILKSIDERHPLIVAAVKDQEIAKGDLLAAQGGFDPIWRTRASTIPIGYYDTGRLDSLLVQPTALGGASLFAGYRIGVGSFAFYDGKAETLSLGEARAGVTVPLLRDLLIDTRRAALWSARLSPAIADATIAATKLELGRGAAIRYWNWVEAGRARQVSKDFGKGPDALRPVDVELAVVVDIPLLARTASGKLDAATAKSEKLEAQRKFLVDRIAADVRDALAAETAARLRVALARQELALANKLAQAERDAFALGTSTMLMVNLREQYAAEAALKEVVALADWQRAIAVFRAVTGKLPGMT